MVAVVVGGSAALAAGAAAITVYLRASRDVVERYILPESELSFGAKAPAQRSYGAGRSSALAVSFPGMPPLPPAAASPEGGAAADPGGWSGRAGQYGLGGPVGPLSAEVVYWRGQRVFLRRVAVEMALRRPPPLEMAGPSAAAGDDGPGSGGGGGGADEGGGGGSAGARKGLGLRAANAGPVSILLRRLSLAPREREREPPSLSSQDEAEPSSAASHPRSVGFKMQTPVPSSSA